MKLGDIQISVLDVASDDRNTATKAQLTKIQRIVYTAIHLYIHLMFGLTLSSMAPAFVDFAQLLDTDVKWIGLFPTFQAVGTLIGSFSTLMFKWLNRQITLSVLIALMGICTILMPWSTQLWHLYLCILVYGLGLGAWNGTNNVILIEMWQKKSPSMLQFSQFMYGIGTILGPLLASYYVIGNMQCPGVWPVDCDGGHVLDVSNKTVNNITLGHSVCSDECLHYNRRPMLRIPYIIGGVLLILGGLSLLVMFKVKAYYYENVGQIEVVTSPEMRRRHDQYVPKRTILVCISLVFAFGIMSENMYTDFSTTYFQYIPLHLTAETAAQIFSTMAIALSIGRALSIFVAMYLRPQTMISYQFAIVFAGYMFQWFGQGQLETLWASAIVICFGYSSIFICLFSFVGQYMEVTDRIGGLFIGSYNAIYVFLPYFISISIQTMATTFVLIELFCVFVAIISFAVVLVAVRFVPKDLIRKLGPMDGH